MILEEFINNIRSSKLEIVDLTQPLNEQTPILTLPEEFGQTIPFKKKEISKYDEKGPGWYWNNFETGEHTGTHLDSPNHWVTGQDKFSVDKIPVEMFLGNGCLIDMEKEVEENPNALLTPSHIEEWEKQNGNIPKKSWVLIKTGWSSRFNDQEAYANFNTNDQMPNTPGISKEASELLANEKDVLGVGVETVGTDAGIAPSFDPQFPNHNIMHGAGKMGLTSLCNLDLIPSKGSIIIALPLKIEDGSGSPVRVIAIK